MTEIQFISIILMATYFTGLIGIIKELIQEMRNPNPFAKVLFSAMPLSNRVLFHVALFTIGPFLWFASRFTQVWDPQKKA